MAVTMNSFWDNAGTVIPGGDAEYVVAEQPIAEYDNWFNSNVVADIQAVIDDVINKFNANTILKADTDNTPAALVVAEQTIVGRKTGNHIAALTDAEVLVIIGVEAGATADQTNTEIRDAVEAAADSNTFTDADHTKLNGVDALADVTADNNPKLHNSSHEAGGSDRIESLPTYVVASDNLLYSNDAEKSVTNNTFEKIKETKNTATVGTVRITFDMKCSVSDTVHARVYVNGVWASSTTHATGSTSWTSKTDDISVDMGDLIQIYVDGYTNTIYIRNFRINGTLSKFDYISQDP